MADPETVRGSLPAGLYELLLSQGLRQRLIDRGETRPLDPGEAHTALAQSLERLLVRVLARNSGASRLAWQHRLLERIETLLREELPVEEYPDLQLSHPWQWLMAVEGESHQVMARPDTPLSRSALLTGTRLDPALGLQLVKELATADRVDILCSFIRWGGVRILMPELRRLCERSPSGATALRIITTSYMGNTDADAVEALLELPATEVRVSYDTRQTRLHAKAYLIHRETGFGSAYVGSANLSRAALSEGLEWTTKISQYELPHLWQKLTSTFDSYWLDADFEPVTRETVPRLVTALKTERLPAEQRPQTFFDLRPFAFQQEILDQLRSERDLHGRDRHLVVAATGTGKTMIAAFDYRQWCETQPGPRPPLLFVAHRQEILEQALHCFRAVLRDQNFGDLLVGSHRPEQTRHLFCSIQSYVSRELWREPADGWRYIVVDEFHHAAAASYRRLLEHHQPRVWLGLTATPERSDGLDVTRLFGGRFSAEIRLPDAINRQLLCPFQYFGVSDSDEFDLSKLRWERGGYRVEDLDRLYTGNDLRARLVLGQLGEIVRSVGGMRGVGFCVSVAHAEFMARRFNEWGVPALAVTGDTPDEVRRASRQQLVERSVNILFTVDLLSEGVDIPEIDTVLLLRPTESLTVFLQQIGRGLRRHPGKEQLTIIDFIAQQRREFRFADRFRALGTNPTAALETEVEQGFPHVPLGCLIQLQRVAQQRVLDNVRASLRQTTSQVVRQLSRFRAQAGRGPSLEEALVYCGLSLDDLLKRGLWSRLLHEAGCGPGPVAPDEEVLARGLRRVALQDDPRQLQAWLCFLGHDAGTASEEADALRRVMLQVGLWGEPGLAMDESAAWARLLRNASVVHDLREVLELRRRQTQVLSPATDVPGCGPLAVHAHYSRNEILVALGMWRGGENRRRMVNEGVLHVPDRRLDVFFVTLRKTETEYSPTTMYADYALSERLFHWQSQSTTAVDSKTGRRYVGHREQGWTPLLFVRETRKLPTGATAPYAFLGPCEYVSHEGSRPISIVWRTQYPIPARLLRDFASQRVG
jgi:superfamily II DNA or RNA helicase/HKD family nuclease